MEAESQRLFNTGSGTSPLKIKVVGVGGAGANAVDGLKLDDLGDVRLAVVNTDAQALASSPVTEKLVLGRSVTRGLGAGGEPEIGRRAAEADRDAIGQMVGGVDLVILVAGLGGGTGSGATAVMAEVAAQSGALVLAFVTLPFNFEGARRKGIAEEAMGDLRQRVHGLISMPNDVLLQEGEEDPSVLNAFAVMDRWIGRGVNSICSMLLKTGLINQDFGSLRSVFQSCGGRTIFGTGSGSGPEFVHRALEDLFLCPLLHLGERPSRLDRILVNLIGGADLGISKVNEVMSTVSAHFGSRQDIVFGAVIDESRRQSLEICILGKAEVASTGKPVREAAPAGTRAPRTLDEIGAAAAAQPPRETPPARAVHESKLRERKKSEAEQNEFDFAQAEAQRGYFNRTDLNLYKDEDLDVPTFFRRGVKIRLKV